MYTLTQHVFMSWKWVTSFFKQDWEFEDYPVRVRRNGVDDVEIAWIAQFMGWPGPVGLGPSPQIACENLRKNFEEIRSHRLKVSDALPRPGTHEPVRFASSERVSADPQLLERFVHEVLEFAPDSPVFLSDGSSLHDFGDEDEVERLRGKIRGVFGVETADLQDANIAEILQRVKQLGREHGLAS